MRVHLTLLIALIPLALYGQEQPLVFRGARLYPISQPPIERGVLVVQHGKIVAVGPGGEVTIPAQATV